MGCRTSRRLVSHTCKHNCATTTHARRPVLQETAVTAQLYGFYAELTAKYGSSQAKVRVWAVCGRPLRGSRCQPRLLGAGMAASADAGNRARMLVCP
jgi:hypothetical protein